MKHAFPTLFTNFIQDSFFSIWQNELFEEKKIEVNVLRLDAQHLHIGGNKLYKLYYNLIEAKQQNQYQILTFGGAYSNHLRATACAAKELGFRAIGIVRGEKPENLSHVLKFCELEGMQLHYISRTDYRDKNSSEVQSKLKKTFGNFYQVPEGGSNALAVKGCKEIIKTINKQSKKPEYVVLATGTGGTTAGLLAECEEDQKIIAISSLKGGSFLKEDIQNLLLDYFQDENKAQQKVESLILQTDFHEGGYAKKSDRLERFISDFNQKSDYEIEFVYTGKAFMATQLLAKNDFFKVGSKVTLIHTGGVF